MVQPHASMKKIIHLFLMLKTAKKKTKSRSVLRFQRWQTKRLLTSLHWLCNCLMEDLFLSLFGKIKVTLVAALEKKNKHSEQLRRKSFLYSSCSPLLDCSFKDLSRLSQDGHRIIHCRHNPGRFHTYIFGRVHNRTRAHTCCRCSPRLR